MTASTRVFSMHGGAKGALGFVGFLCCVTIVAIPLGIYFFWRVSRAQVELGADALVAKGLGTKTVRFSEMAQIGTVSAHVVGGGLGGIMARKKCGGDTATHLAILTTQGKTVMFMASMYEDFEEMLHEVSARAGKQLIPLEMGAIKPKWPEA